MMMIMAMTTTMTTTNTMPTKNTLLKKHGLVRLSLVEEQSIQLYRFSVQLSPSGNIHNVHTHNTQEWGALE